VSAVKLETLYIQGSEAVLNPILEAHPARRQQGAIRPAQMLLINAKGEAGIKLETAL